MDQNKRKGAREMILIEIKFLQYGNPFLEVGKQYIAEEYVAGTFLIQDQHVVFPEEVKLIGKFTEKLNYDYKGVKGTGISVVVMEFYDMPDKVISLKDFSEYKIREGRPYGSRDAKLKKIFYGRMSKKQFNSLNKWEG